MSAIDLSSLPPPQVITQLDYEATLAQMLTTLRSYDPAFTTISEADPAYKILEIAAYYILHRTEAANNDARALMLAYATGADLDHIGTTYYHGTQRHTLQAANPATSPPTPEIKESDADYRRRLLLHPASLSVAGPQNAYIFHALGAHPNVSDATVTSPSPACVTVTVLGRNASGVPDDETLQAVTTALNADTVRPVADRVTVQAAQVVSYTIEAAISVPHGPDAAALAATIAANLQAYKDAPRRLGRDIARSAIYAALHIAGVERVTLTQPAQDIDISPAQASLCSAVAVTINGAPLEV